MGSDSDRSEQMHVLLCADPNYYQHLSVVAVSLATASQAATVDLHVMTFAGADPAEDLVRKSLEGFPRVHLHVYHVDPDGMDGVCWSERYPKECCLRLLAAHVLPKEIERVLYLDCDLVVLDDLAPLYGIDLAGKVLAAAPDFPWDPDGSESERLKRIGAEGPDRYVNSGVLVIDLVRWRDLGYTARLLDFIDRRAPELAFIDQDAINVVLKGEILVVDPRWNLQARMYRLGRRRFPREHAVASTVGRRPAIVHFTTPDKPWRPGSMAARRTLYAKFRRLTAFELKDEPDRSVWVRTEEVLDRGFARVGLDLRHGVARARRAVARVAGIVFPERRTS